MQIPQNTKNRTTYDPEIPLLGIYIYIYIYMKKRKTLIQKDTCIPVLIAALFMIAKMWKQPKCPSTDV